MGGTSEIVLVGGVREEDVLVGGGKEERRVRGWTDG